MASALISSWSRPLALLTLALSVGILTVSCGGRNTTPTAWYGTLDTPIPGVAILSPITPSPERLKANPELKEQFEHASAVLEKYAGVFARQPGTSAVDVVSPRRVEEDGSITSSAVIMIWVNCTVFGDQPGPLYSLPGWDPIPRHIEGVPIELWNAMPVTGCPEPDYRCERGGSPLPTPQDTNRVRLKYDHLFQRQPNLVEISLAGYHPEYGDSLLLGSKGGIILWVTEKVDQSTLPAADRMPDCLEGVRINIIKVPTSPALPAAE